MPTNRAAWQDKPDIELSIRKTPLPEASSLPPTQLIIHANAWAINPADPIIQSAAGAAIPFVKYPLILGEDLAGTVVAAGSDLSSQFKTGDRVLAMALGAANGKQEMGGFQDFVVVDAMLTSKIPDAMNFVEASVFPLAVATAAVALFKKRFLALPFPTVEEQKETGRVVLVWGGGSAVGSNAIQLARGAGVEVYTTCSPKNFEYVKKLGASQVFDYNSETVVEELVDALDATNCAGIFQAAGSVEPCLQISAKAKGDLLVAAATIVPEDIAPMGVRATMLFNTGEEADSYSETAPAIFGDFLPKALATDRYQVKPEPWIMGTKGLEGVQEGFERLKEGVSARKVVVVAG